MKGRTIRAHFAFSLRGSCCMSLALSCVFPGEGFTPLCVQET